MELSLLATCFMNNNIPRKRGPLSKVPTPKKECSYEVHFQKQINTEKCKVITPQDVFFRIKSCAQTPD